MNVPANGALVTDAYPRRYALSAAWHNADVRPHMTGAQPRQRAAMKTLLCTGTIVLGLGGCTWLAIHPTLTPSAEGLESYTEYEATVRTAQFRAVVRVEGYSPDVSFIGVGVPMIPINQWKWLTGISKDELRIAVSVQFWPLVESVSFSPDTFRIVAAGQAYLPNRVTIAKRCWASSMERVDESKPLAIDGPICVRFDFFTLRPLEEPFALIARELPEIRYTIKRDASAGFVRQ